MRAVVGVRPSPHRIETDDGGTSAYRWHLAVEDKVALEAALGAAETVVAVGIGASNAAEAIRAALRMGADEGVHVQYDPVESPASDKYADVLARTTARESADVVLVGGEVGEMGVEVAQLVGEAMSLPTVSRVTALGADDVETTVDRNALPVQRACGVGEQEVLAVEPPIVLGIDASLGNPRRGTLDDVIAGQEREIRTIDLGSVAPGESRFSMHLGNATVTSVQVNERWGRGNPPTEGNVDERISRMLGRGNSDDEPSGAELIDAPPEEAAEQVVAYLRTHDLL